MQLMEFVTPKPALSQRGRRLSPYLVLGAGLLFTFIVSYRQQWSTYILAGGIFISILFFAAIRSQMRARDEAERSEAEVRASAATMQKILEERERAEAAVKESEERYRELVENANDIVFTLDLEGNVTSVNKAVESITGYTQTELLGMNMSEFLTPGSTQSARSMTERKLAGEERTNYEVDVRAKDGRIFTLEISSRLTIHQGKPVGVQGVARDITTRRHAEEALRRADQRALSEYERLLEKVAGLAQTLGTARDLLAIFRGLREFTLLSVPCDGLFVSLFDPIREAANLTAVAIENVRLLERESTARASAEESNRLKDEFLATVSHELRTPLTAILGWSRMLQGESLGSDMAARAIETIKRNAKAQAQIIDDILDVSRIITGNLYLELQPIELAPVLESAINVVRPTAEAKGIQIGVDFAPKPAAVPGDITRLQQVFCNMLSNAVKFTPAGGKVMVHLRHVNSKVEVEVTDTGQGITAEFLPFVFDRFRQADSTSTRQHGGLGLGLAIARHLIEIHGGSIEARSVGSGQGASFTVALPLAGSVVDTPGVSVTAASIDAEAESRERVKSQQI